MVALRMQTQPNAFVRFRSELNERRLSPLHSDLSIANGNGHGFGEDVKLASGTCPKVNEFSNTFIPISCMTSAEQHMQLVVSETAEYTLYVFHMTTTDVKWQQLWDQQEK